ncbi:LamG domain-containing protein [Flagellimonas sp. DF-77]|uniref:LamG domain-containing protein n=1 Tax=Flagellimonas algarum TaxID=3230298 RepID=UPI00339A1327
MFLSKNHLGWAGSILFSLLALNLQAQEDHYLTFDGTNDYIALPISYNGANSLPVVSVEAWVRTSFSSGSYNANWAIVDFDRSDFYNFFVHGDGRVAFSTYSPTGAIQDFYGSSTVNDGQWHHIAAVYDGTDKFIYVDGVLDGTQTNPHGGTALGKSTTRFGFIGDGSEASSYNANRNGEYYTGDISELRIWHRVLSASEIDANKQPGVVTGGESGLHVLYNFDNGLANDSGPNGFTGELFNGPTFNNTDGVPTGNNGGGTGGNSLWSANGNDVYYETGNVAIGRASVPAGYKLAVDGFVRAREVRVDQDNWPDYVFKADYDLPTLAEIKKHIAEHGHLPNIPSALEIQQNGVALGEMDRLLLEKIEELTLHIIQLKQELETLKSKQQ